MLFYNNIMLRFTTLSQYRNVYCMPCHGLCDDTSNDTSVK